MEKLPDLAPALSFMLLVSPGLSACLIAEPRPVSPTFRSSEKSPARPWSHAQGEAWVPCSVPERALASSSAKPSTGLGTAKPLCPGPSPPGPSKGVIIIISVLHVNKLQLGEAKPITHSLKQGPVIFHFVLLTFIEA